jgi:hypothetical protein
MKHNDVAQQQAVARGAGGKFLEEMGFQPGTPEYDNELYQLRKDNGLVSAEERRRTETPSKK